MRVMKSREMQDLSDDVSDFAEDVMKADMGEKATKAGYLKWIDNGDLADLAEDM